MFFFVVVVFPPLNASGDSDLTFTSKLATCIVFPTLFF